MKIVFSVLLVATLMFSAMADEKDHIADEPAKAATVTVYGTVTDAKTGESLVGVEVQLEGTDMKVYTDFDGQFSFEDILPGEYDISAKYISYEKQKIEKQNIDIFSSELKVQLKPVN